MIKKRLLLGSACVLLLACAVIVVILFRPRNTYEPEPDAYWWWEDDDLFDIDEQRDDFLTVFLNVPYPYEQSLSYISWLAQNAGFRLNFRRCPQAVYNFENFRWVFMEQYGDNAVFTHFLDIANTAMERGYSQNFYQSVATYTPILHERLSAVFPPGELYVIPTREVIFSSRPAVLIRNDIYASFGLEIRSGSDFEELLFWLYNRDPDTVPGVAAPLFADMTTWSICGGFTALNLFMPEMGYTSLAGMFNLGHFTVRNHLWIYDNNVLAFYDTNSSIEAFTRFSMWHQNGLIDFVNDFEDEGLTRYPTILINMLFLDWGMLGFDTTQYTINIFPEPAVYISRKIVAFAAPDVDAREFLRFMEWLDDIDNYTYFLFGIEDVDFIRDPATGYIMSELPPGSNLYNSHHSFVFSRSVFDNQLYYALRTTPNPRGLWAERQALQPPEFILCNENIHNIGNQLNTPRYTIGYFDALGARLYSLFGTLYWDYTDEPAQEIQDAIYHLRATAYRNRPLCPAELVNRAIAGLE